MRFRTPRPLRRYDLILKGRIPPVYLHCRAYPAGVKEEDLKGMEGGALLDLNGELTRGLMEFRAALLERPDKDPRPWSIKGDEASLLDVKREAGRKMLTSCRLCERRCGADRSGGETGACGVGGIDRVRISSIFLHMGEEPELVPSLTVFFSGCTLECAFCQNHDISREPSSGALMSPRRLAGKIGSMYKEGGGPINVNWVGGDPTPAVPYILEVLAAMEPPLAQVFNSNMYLTEEAMGLITGVVDLYLADFKFGADDCARRLAGVRRYTEVVARNHRMAADGADLIVRHLILPGHLECCTYPVIRTLEEDIGHERVRLNLMDQYRPVYRAGEHPDIDRHLGPADLGKAVSYAEGLGFESPY